MIPGSGGGNPNPNMQMPGFGVPQPGANIISAPPIITGHRFGMGMPPTMMGGMFPGAGLGMMPNPAMGNPMVPGMFPGMMQNVPPPMGQPAPVMMHTEQPPVDMVDAALRKVFVKNIPEDVPDTFMETILKECGNVTQWKRTKNEKDIPLRFGTCEFETVEGMLRCLRIMNNLKLLDSYLQINASDKTEAFIGEWTETKKKEWQATKDPSAREEDFERSLQKDDANALERIHILIDNFDVNKAREAKEKEEEKKEHPKEKERDRKKKTHLKELEKNFKKELDKWREYEDKMDKDRRKEKEREREREQEKEKFKHRLLEKELEYDSEEERRRKSNTKYLEQRKKTRQKELEEDELERRKEIMEEEEKRKANEENLMEIEPPMENIMPIHSHDMEGQDNPLTRGEQPTLINPKPRSKFMFQTIEPGVQEPAPQTDGGKPAFQIEIGGPAAQKATKGAAQTMFKEDMEKEDEAMQLYNRKHKIQAKVEKPATTQENVVTVDPKSKSATIQFGVTVPVAPTNEAQKVLSELQGLIKQIPTNKSDLFNYKINWTLLATSDLIEKKVKPWLKKQSVEYIGQEEMDFVNMILKRLANRESPQRIMEKVEKLLDEEAEDFTMKLWRMLIFELLKLEHTSQLDSK